MVGAADADAPSVSSLTNQLLPCVLEMVLLWWARALREFLSVEKSTMVGLSSVTFVLLVEVGLLTLNASNQEGLAPLNLSSSLLTEKSIINRVVSQWARWAVTCIWSNLLIWWIFLSRHLFWMIMRIWIQVHIRWGWPGNQAASSPPSPASREIIWPVVCWLWWYNSWPWSFPVTATLQTYWTLDAEAFRVFLWSCVAAGLVIYLEANRYQARKEYYQ